MAINGERNGVWHRRKAIHRHGRGGPDQRIYQKAPQPHPRPAGDPRWLSLRYLSTPVTIAEGAVFGRVRSEVHDDQSETTIGHDTRSLAFEGAGDRRESARGIVQ